MRRNVCCVDPYCCPRGMTQASNTSNVMLDVWGVMAKRIAVAPLAIASGAVVLPG